MLDVSEFATPSAAKEAAVARYIAENPKPADPGPEPDTIRRPSLVSLTNGARLWLEVVSDYTGASIRFCHSGGISGSNFSGMNVEELIALRSEIDRAVEDFDVLNEYHQRRKAFLEADRKWNDTMYSVERAAERAWYKSHPDTEVEDEDDEF